MNALKSLLTGLCLTAFPALVLAQQTPAPTGSVQGIYTCIDGKGRRLTADRPITECADREQRVLNPSGTLKTKLTPELTVHERAELDIKEKAKEEEQARLNEEKRRDRALMVRYPKKAVHDSERTEALTKIKLVRHTAQVRVEDLQHQQNTLRQEMEFYKKDSSKVPPSLQRQVEEITQNLASQARFIAEQDGEIKRINARFDEELVRLKQLWATLGPVKAPR